MAAALSFFLCVAYVQEKDVEDHEFEDDLGGRLHFGEIKWVYAAHSRDEAISLFMDAIERQFGRYEIRRFVSCEPHDLLVSPGFVCSIR